MYNLFQHTVYLKTVGVDKNPLEIAFMDQYESNAGTWAFPFRCTDLLPTTEVNQQSLFALSFISALCSKLRPHLEGIVAECLFLDWLWGSDLYRCVCCTHVHQISRRAKTDWSLISLFLKGLSDQGMALLQHRSLDPHQGINSWWNMRAFYQCFHELSDFNILSSSRKVILQEMATEYKNKSHILLYCPNKCITLYFDIT